MKILLFIGTGLILSAFIGALVVRQYYKILSSKPQVLEKFNIEKHKGIKRWVVILFVVLWLTIGGIISFLQEHSQQDSVDNQQPKIEENLLPNSEDVNRPLYSENANKSHN